MRLMTVQVPEGTGSRVVEFAHKADAKNICFWSSSNGEKRIDVVMACLSNRRVEEYIDDLNTIEGVQITLLPQGVIAMYPPQNETPDQVTNVQDRSPIEIFLAALQSVGSWTGFLSYAALGSVIVWIGLFTNSSYLLVGAMLVAPFAGPAMNMAIATARGDKHLMKRALLRYFVSIMLTIAVAYLLSLLLQQQAATSSMVSASQVSSTAILLALAAGAAGAINLVQSQRSSLVSGAAAGMLVAASLAPPAGVIGMALAIGEWQMLKGGLFTLLLQLVGINLSGSLIFRTYGLKAKGPRYNKGKHHVVVIGIAATILLLGGLCWWQFRKEPNLERSSISKRAEQEIKETVNKYPYAGLVEASASFTRASIPNQNTLLCIVYVQAKNGPSEDTIKHELTNKIQRAILKRLDNVTPVVSVNVMEDWQVQDENLPVK